jgi:transcriptional regulator with PAS, ATPase and Fis domain
MVEQANGGTLFLDEIGEMELGVQPKLLRFLETRRARRVGGDGEYKVSLRVISATNRNLEEEIAEKRFRADLYYRLAETVLQIPPLRTRLEDIPELALVFLKMANERFGKNIETLEPALIERFQKYHWPGNVRELKSAVDRLVLLFDGPVLRAPWWDPPESVAFGTPAMVIPVATGSMNANPPNQKQKRDQARQLLAESDNDFTWVAAQLGINPSTLWRWRKAGKV